MRDLASLPLVALLLLAACGGGGEPDECNTFDECDRLLATAQVDGRHLTVTLDEWEDNGFTRVGDTVVTVVMMAFRSSPAGLEGVQFWIDGFHGVGAYPVVDYYGVGTAMAVYGGHDALSSTSYWAQGGPGDSVWVTAYDSVAGAIGGSFQFTGSSGDEEVLVTDGSFRGRVEPYVAGAAARSAPTRQIGE